MEGGVRRRVRLPRIEIEGLAFNIFAKFELHNWKDNATKGREG
jgi:hypothetical protein